MRRFRVTSRIDAAGGRASARSWYSIRGIRTAADGGTEAEIRIFDDIGWWGVTAGALARDLEALGKVDRIRVLINSAGGDVFESFAVFNLLREHPAAITTRVEGLAASGASLIALAGDQVEIHSTAFMMIHNPYGLVIGDAREMRAFADTLDKVAGPMIATYAAKMSEDPETIRNMLDEETWFTGEEAVDAGLADVLVSSAAAGGTDEGGDAPEASASRSGLAAFRKVPEELGGTAAPEGEGIVDLMRRRVRQSELEIDIDTGV